MDLIIDFILLCVIVSLAWVQGKWLLSMDDRLDKMESLVGKHDDTLYPLAMPVKTYRREDRHEDTGH